MEWMAILLFLSVIAFLMLGYPVAFTLGGVALLFAGFGALFQVFDLSMLGFFPERLFGIMNNQILIAVPLFIFMGVMLERSKIAEQLLETMALLFGGKSGGLAIAVTLVGMLLAASTGIVGATVVTMGLLSLPTMLKRGYDASLSCGIICASGTLGQIIPPSIVLILLGDQLSSAYQQAQLQQGIFSPETLSVGDLFAGALLPGLLLVSLYLAYILLMARLRPQDLPPIPEEERNNINLKQLLQALLPPLLLMVSVLGSILFGLATPTEAASVGAMGALLLALLKKQLNIKRLKEVMENTMQITSMVFLILVGASLFSLVFRGFGGDELVHQWLSNLPGGKWTALLIVMLLMFFLGFVLDFIEITFVVIPIVAPILFMMEIDPIWLGILIALNLQTSFLTPPFGFALFYLRGVAPNSVSTREIYRGAIPFIFIQIIALLILSLWPTLATWLPHQIYG